MVGSIYGGHSPCREDTITHPEELLLLDKQTNKQTNEANHILNNLGVAPAQCIVVVHERCGLFGMGGFPPIITNRKGSWVTLSLLQRGRRSEGLLCSQQEHPPAFPAPKVYCQ